METTNNRNRRTKSEQSPLYESGGRLQPRDKDLEEAVLGALMLEKDAYTIVCDILKPERIVLGSIFQRSESLLRPKMQEILEKECLTYPLKVCEVVPAKLGDNIGDYAALAVASMNREN